MIQQENLKKRLAKLAAPIFIETLLIMMLGAVDTVMLSRHSDNSVAAVGVVNQIIMLTFLVFEVINLGTSVLCSQYIGARLHKQVVQVVGVSILVNLVVGITISMLLFGCAGPILRLMGLGPELMQDGMDYMRIVGAFAFFQALSLTLSASLRSANKAVYPMLVTVVVNILNIIGNYSLIFGRFGFSDVLTLFLGLDTYVELYKGGIQPLSTFAWSKRDNDILVRLIVKKKPVRIVYQSLRLTRTDFPVLASAVVCLDGKWQAVIGARPQRALLVEDEEKILEGGLTEENIQKFVAYVTKKTPTGSNMRAGADYRSHLVEVQVRRALEEMRGETNAD